jgi:hypothetical protein
MARKPKPECKICGWPLDGGQCYRTELHWTVCPTCRTTVDAGRSCKNGCTDGRGVAAVESLIADGLIERVTR